MSEKVAYFPSIKRYPVVDPQTPPDEEHYAYDKNGNLTTKLMPTGESLVMTYDERNRLETKSSPTDQDYLQWQVGYTLSGQRESVTRGGDSWGWTYEALTGRLKTFTDPSNRTITYGYDSNGNRTSLKTSTYPEATRFEYDALNRLTHVRDRNDLTTTYNYDTQRGVLDNVQYPNGTATTYAYDPLDRVEDIQHLNGTNLLASFHYTLADNGRRDAIVERIAGVDSAVSYGYDDLDRLVSEIRTGANAYNIGFDYDDVGNRLIETRNQTTETHYTYDERDRLLCESGGLNPLCQNPTTSYLWDANGRLRSKGTEAYNWDVEDRMLSHEGATTTTFAYDIDGIRYRKVADATTTDYLVDANRTYQEVLEEWQGGTQPAMEYLHGMGLLWQRNSSGVQSYFHGDAQMSTRLLTTATGSAQNLFTYEAFGTDVGLLGPAATPYRYSGQQFDLPTGLYYVRARYICPRVGRFLSADPLGYPDGPNQYAAFGAEPIGNSDPSGLLLVRRVKGIGQQAPLYRVVFEVKPSMFERVARWGAPSVVKNTEKVGDLVRSEVYFQTERPTELLVSPGNRDRERSNPTPSFIRRFLLKRQLFDGGMGADIKNRDRLIGEFEAEVLKRLVAAGVKDFVSPSMPIDPRVGVVLDDAGLQILHETINHVLQEWKGTKRMFEGVDLFFGITEVDAMKDAYDVETIQFRADEVYQGK